jgi:hypothetical protein
MRAFWRTPWCCGFYRPEPGQLKATLNRMLLTAQTGWKKNAPGT